MANYAIGDIQGCYHEFMELLSKLNYNPKKDSLWIAGDMVNRGPDSLETLKFIFENRKNIRCVLGNHDLHLMAIYFGIREPRLSDTLNKILKHKQRHDWIEWLSTLPLIQYDSSTDFCMIHAGLAPQWTLKQAIKYSKEVENAIQGKKAETFFKNMYGNSPTNWKNELTDYRRLRCITNYFTRVRAVKLNGSMDFNYKGSIDSLPSNYLAWFKHPHRKTKSHKIIFGHWAALEGYVDNKKLFGIDTGCVWGRYLTALNMDTLELTFSCAK